jgi:cytidylate kinase
MSSVHPPASAVVFNKITLTGDLGSGKSVVSSRLCAATGYEYLSTGRIQRQLAAELGIDTLEMNRRADTDPTIDQRIDGVFLSLNSDPRGYVVDSRLAWFFIHTSFKVYLQVDTFVAAGRILSDPSRNSEQYTSVEEAVEKIRARKASENARFLAKYGADCANLHNFDVVIDTTHRTPDEVSALIFKALEAKVAGIPFPRFL